MRVQGSLHMEALTFVATCERLSLAAMGMRMKCSMDTSGWWWNLV